MLGKENKHSRHFRKAHCRDDEELAYVLDGYIGEMMGKGDDTQRNGALIITNKRVAFVRKGIFGEVFETIPLNKITSVETKSLLGHRVLRFHTSNDELAFKSFSKKELFDSARDYVEEAREQGDARLTNPPTTSEDADILKRIEDLGRLRDSGLLSEEQFEEKKSELISRL